VTFTRHPLNKAFNWATLRPPFRCITEEQAVAYDELGYFVMENAFDPASVQDVMAEIDPYEDELEAQLLKADGAKVFISRAGEITFTTHLAVRSQRLRRFVGRAPLADVYNDLIGPDVRLYWDHYATETGLVCFDESRAAVPAPVGAGGMVVLSSLTPRCTGPNRTDAVRKAYIVQYAHDGAAVAFEEPSGILRHVSADEPDRQFLVLRDGQQAI